ncbi:MAG: WbqC family protein [Candidatus Tumulicola sp.]
MQPYFFPYPRYFRLFAEVDEFIIHDDAQFIKGGRVNRTEVPGPHGESEWLTLPLAKHSSDILIRDCAFAGDARARFDRSLRRLTWVTSSKGPAADRVREYLYAPLLSPIGYLETGLRLIVELLGIHVRISRSSALRLGSLRRQDRVIAAVKAVGGTEYVNLPGGQALYSREAFTMQKIELTFLRPYEGAHRQMLPALMTLAPRDIPL